MLDLRIQDPVFREGLLQIDVLANDHSSGTQLLLMEKVESISIYAGESPSGGPIRVGGEWVVT